MSRVTTRDAWVQRLIVASCVLFISVLALSAVFDASIRVLHLFQAAIYVAVMLLARKRSAWDPARFLGGGVLAIGYMAGIIVLFGPQYIRLLRRVFGI